MHAAQHLRGCAVCEHEERRQDDEARPPPLAVEIHVPIRNHRSLWQNVANTHGFQREFLEIVGIDSQNTKLSFTKYFDA